MQIKISSVERQRYPMFSIGQNASTLPNGTTILISWPLFTDYESCWLLVPPLALDQLMPEAIAVTPPINQMTKPKPTHSYRLPNSFCFPFLKKK